MCLIPPPPLAPLPPVPFIQSLNGYTFDQTNALFIQLENHRSSNGPFDIYLEEENSGQAYLICASVVTDDQDYEAAVACPLTALPPGFYDLYSTQMGLSVHIAQAAQTVKILNNSIPTIRFVEGQNVWATNTIIQLELSAHLLADGPFDLLLYHSDGTLLETIAAGLAGDSGAFEWQVPDTVRI